MASWPQRRMVENQVCLSYVIKNVLRSLFWILDSEYWIRFFHISFQETLSSGLRSEFSCRYLLAVIPVTFLNWPERCWTLLYPSL